MNRLNNNRASGSDELPCELLKHGSNVIAKPISDVFNRAITDQEILSQIGQGIIILLPKPGQPVGAMTSLRPIVLRTTAKTALLRYPRIKKSYLEVTSRHRYVVD